MKAVDEVRLTLGGLDPAWDSRPEDAERRTRDLARILASDRTAPPARRAVLRRRLILAAGGVVLAVAAGGVALESIRKPQPAYAATPAMLTYGPPASAEPASTRLRHLAEVAAGKPAPPRPTGSVEHLESANWFLNSSVTDGRTTSAVVPEQWRSWQTDDGAGREVRKALPPIFRSEADRREWKRRGGQIDSSEETRDYTSGEYYSHWQGPVPTDATALREWLTTGVPAHEAPVQYLESVTELAGVRMLNPAQRAAALRLLAELPGITVTGTVTDRAGRPGEAFSITSDFHGLPVQYTVIIDPGSGALLGYEEVLTETAGMLNVPIPAVITYRSYLVAEYAAMPR